MHKFKVQSRVVIKDSVASRIKDAKDVASIKVKMEATHSGFVNQNFSFYTPSGMRNGVDSFTLPYNKPVTVNHDSNTDPIGRVLESKYVDYNLINDSLEITGNTKDYIKKIDKYLKGPIPKSAGFKGLGHIELIGEITDKSAIQAVLDKRYLTVSIGATVSKAICSHCGTDKASDTCDHYKGDFVDGESVFLICGDMKFDHISYVQTPADPFAITTYQEDSLEGFVEVVDFVLSKKEENMKLKKSDILQCAKDITASLTALGLEDSASKIADLAKDAKASSFVFSEDKLLPLVDKSSCVTAFFLVQQMEDGEEKEGMLSAIRTRADVFLTDSETLEACVDSLLKAKEAKETKEQEEKAKLSSEVSDAQMAKITEAVTDAIKSALAGLVDVKDSYVASRASILEKENVVLQKENAELLKTLKDSLITQILSFSDRGSDQEYKDRLQARTISSLKDSLQDLLSASPASVSDSKLENLQKVVVNDAVIVEDEKEENAKTIEVTDNKADTSVLTVDQVKQERLRLISSEGIGAAAKYIHDLRVAGKLPSGYA